MDMENKLNHPETLFIIKVDQTSVSEITEHKVLSYYACAERSYPEPICKIYRYTLDNNNYVELAEDKNFAENRHLMSTIGNTDPWIRSTWVFKNLEDATIRYEKELERINNTLDLSRITDIEYIQERLIAASRVPRKFFNFK